MNFSVAINALSRQAPVSASLATKPVGLLELARLAGKNMLRVIPEETKHRTYMRGPVNIHWICDPEIIAELLIGKGRRFPKAKFTKDILGSAIGNGLILSEGEKWKVQRHRYAPIFAARNLPMLVTHFAQTGQALARQALEGGGEVDVAGLAPEATLTNISRVMFSGTETLDPAELRKGLKSYFEYISNISLFDLMGMPSWLPRKKWLKSKRPVTSMRKLAREVIEERRAEGRVHPQDFLDLMITTLEEDVEDLDTTVDNLLTFVVAGHETAANTLSWGLYLLALYPEVQASLREEVLSACGNAPITFDGIQKMPKVLAHVRETLRLYPAAALFTRDASEDVTIKDIHFTRGDALFFPVYSIHRNSMLWDAPDEYSADRFLGKRPQRGQFIPFGDGPRICIGAQYAETEITVLMAELIRKVELTMSDKTIPEPVLTFTMRPGGPMNLRAKRV